jgi:hypothetical protein
VTGLHRLTRTASVGFDLFRHESSFEAELQMKVNNNRYVTEPLCIFMEDRGERELAIQSHDS